VAELGKEIGPSDFLSSGLDESSCAPGTYLKAAEGHGTWGSFESDFSGDNTRCSLKIELCDKLRAPLGSSC